MRLEIATNFHDQWVILLCLRLCPTLRDEFVTQAYVRAARDGRGIPEPFKRGPTARVRVPPPASGSSICLTGTCVRETSLPGRTPDRGRLRSLCGRGGRILES